MYAYISRRFVHFPANSLIPSNPLIEIIFIPIGIKGSIVGVCYLFGKDFFNAN